MLLRSTLIYAPAILLSRLSAMLLLIVITRLTNQTEYGLLVLVVTIGEMADMAISSWLRLVLIRLGGSGEVSRGTLRRGAMVLVSSTLVAVLVAGGAAVTMVPERWQDFAVAVGLYIAAGSISRFGLTILQMQQQHALYTLLEGLRALLAIALPVAALIYIAPDFLVASLASGLATLIAGVLTVLVALRRTVAGEPRFDYRDLLYQGAPLFALAIVGFALGSVERLFLKGFWGADAVALYVAAYSLARQPVDVISNAVNSGGYPELIRRFDTDGQTVAAQFIAEQMALMAKLVFPAAVLLIVLRDDFATLILPADYRSVAQDIFPAIVAGVLCMNFKTFVFDNVFHAYKRNWLQVASFLPGALGAVVLAWLIVPPMGPLGAAYAFLGGAVLALIASIVASSWLVILPIPYLAIGQAVVIATGTGLAALVVTRSLGPDAGALMRLVAGGTTGGAAFLCLTALFNLRQAMERLSSLRRAG